MAATRLALAVGQTSTVTLSGSFGPVQIGASQNWANNANSQTLTISAPINGTSTTVGGVQTLTFNGTGTGGVTLSGPIGDGSGGGKLALVFNQSGTTVLSGTNTFTGGVTIQSGTVRLGSAGALSTTGTALNSAANTPVAFGAGSTGDLQLNGNSVAVTSLSTNTTAGAPIVENASPTATNAAIFVIVPSNTTSTFAGTLQDGPGGGTLALITGGAGTFALKSAATYTGGTTVASGTMVLGSGGSLPATNTLAIGNSQTNSSGTFQLGDCGWPRQSQPSPTSSLRPVPASTNAVVGGNSAVSTLTINTAGTVYYNGLLGGSGTNNNLALNIAGGGNVTL